MSFRCSCKYCGESWDLSYYYPGLKLKCEKCKDTNIGVKKIDDSSGDVFGYGDSKKAEDAYFSKKKHGESV